MQSPFTNSIASDLVCFLKRVVRDKCQSKWIATIDNKLCPVKNTVTVGLFIQELSFRGGYYFPFVNKAH